MEAEDSNLTSTPSANFILLASQEETQPSQNEDEMRHILRNLPGLQTESSKAPETGNIQTDTAMKRAAVLVLDSEVESTKGERTGAESSESPAVVSESEDVSDAKEVTVILKQGPVDSDLDNEDDLQELPSPCEPDRSGQTPSTGKDVSGSPSNDSSFQSHGQTGLGSYDQAELYTTQKGHAKGQRFTLIQPSPSQQNMFSSDEDEDERQVATPSEHLASLQLSSAPMLVPETLEDADDAIPPSIDLNCSPLIIPGSPTEGDILSEDEMEIGGDYDINAANTFSDHSKGFDYKQSSSNTISNSGGQEVIPRSGSQQQESSVMNIDSSEELRGGFRPGPTFADDNQSGSLHLHLSESQMTNKDGDVTVVEMASQGQYVGKAGNVEYVTETPTKKGSQVTRPSTRIPPLSDPSPDSQKDDVIVISSQSAETTLQDEDCESLSLHLTPSQMTQGQQSQRSQRSQKSRKKERQRDKDKNDNPQIGWKDDEQFEEKIRVSIEEEAKSPSQPSEEFMRTSPVEEPAYLPSIPASGVVLKSNSRAFSSSDPGKVKGHSQEDTEVRPQSQQYRMSSTELRSREPVRRSLIGLTLSMITDQSEPVSERTFQLEKPDILPLRDSEKEKHLKEDVFRRTRHGRRQQKQFQIQDESCSDEDDGNTYTAVGDRAKTLKHKQPEAQTSAHQSETFQDTLYSQQTSENVSAMEEATEQYEVPTVNLAESLEERVKIVGRRGQHGSQTIQQPTSPALASPTSGNRSSDHTTNISVDREVLLHSSSDVLESVSVTRERESTTVTQGTVSMTSPPSLTSPISVTLNPVDEGQGHVDTSSDKRTRKTSHRLPHSKDIESHLRQENVGIVSAKRHPQFALVRRKKASSTRRLRSVQQKKLATVVERNRQRRASLEALHSPKTAASTGSFVSSTQYFPKKDSPSTSKDPYVFHGTQSQITPEERRIEAQHHSILSTSSAIDSTPVSHRKQRKKLSQDKNSFNEPAVPVPGISTPSRPHVWFQTSPELVTSHSDTTVTTIGSLQSLPSSISQSSSSLGQIMSPRLSTSVSHSTVRRVSLDQLQSDTLPLEESDDEKYRKEIVVTRSVMQYIRTQTEVRIINPQGLLVDSTVSEDNGKPVLMEEKIHKKIKFISYPSPSRSVSTLTSGDYGDISSSLSRSSGSHGSKTSISGSLGTADAVSSMLDKSEVAKVTRVESITTHVAMEKGKELKESVSSLPAIEESPASYKADVSSNLTQSMPAIESVSRRSSDIGIDDIILSRGGAESGAPTARGGANLDKGGAKQVAGGSYYDDEYDTASPHEASTINRTGSVIHSRTVSVESPKTSDSLFTTPEKRRPGRPKRKSSLLSDTEKRKSTELKASSNGSSSGKDTSEPSQEEKTTARGTRVSKRLSTEGAPSSTNTERSDSDNLSPKIPNQDVPAPNAADKFMYDLVTSSGEPGSRVIARWKDGFYYPGYIKEETENGCRVRFDDGDMLLVKKCYILRVEKLPAGQSVMVLTDEGDFVSGMITDQKEKQYIVAMDTGDSGEFTRSQVIMTADQAAVFVSDRGCLVTMGTAGPAVTPSKPADVCLENLMEAPRRSTGKKAPPHDAGAAGSERGKKRKLSAVQPQATSTPTPKGKSESLLVKRRKIQEETTFIPEASPVGSRSPRKARVDLFSGKEEPEILFQDMIFMLTNVVKTAEQKNEDKQLLQDSSLETSTDESMDESQPTVAFNKDELVKLIQERGGEVMEKFDQSKIDSCQSCFVLSSSYQRTIKYLKALALGIPCMSHMWVVDSAREGKLLGMKAYVLPAGISLEKKKLMEWKADNNTLTNITAHICSKNIKFQEEWFAILTLAKCKVLPSLQLVFKKGKKGKGQQPDVIVTDDKCPAAVVKQATDHSIPLVSTEWVIQSLITGRPVGYTAHPQYKHNAGS